MADYLNFTKIVPPNPNDPTVDVNDINDNWDLLDTKLNPYINGGTLVVIEAGQEYFDPSFRYSVWTGSATRNPDTIDDNWSAWTALPVASSRAIRPSFTPKWRNNSVLRMVELTGGFLFDASANPWTMGSLITLNADTSGAIPSSMQPIGGSHSTEAATSLSAGTTVCAAAYIYIDKPGGNTFTRIRAQYLGGPGGGNFIQLEQVWWWY